MEIFPSLISSDILNLQNTINLLDAHCHGYHIDVMDDHFVPNLTWGPVFINSITQKTQRSLHVHLMVDNPASWIDSFNRLEQEQLYKEYTVKGLEWIAPMIGSKGWKKHVADIRELLMEGT